MRIVNRIFTLTSLMFSLTAVATPISRSLIATDRAGKAHVRIVKVADYTRECENPPVWSIKPEVLCEGDIDIEVRTMTTLVPGKSGPRSVNALNCSDTVLNELFAFTGEVGIYYDELKPGVLSKSVFARMFLDSQTVSQRIIDAIGNGTNIPAKVEFSTINTDLSQVTFNIRNSNHFSSSGCDGGLPVTNSPLVVYALDFDIKEFKK